MFKVLLAIKILLLVILKYVCNNVFFSFKIILNIGNATLNATGNEKDFSKEVLIITALLP